MLENLEASETSSVHSLRMQGMFCPMMCFKSRVCAGKKKKLCLIVAQNSQTLFVQCCYFGKHAILFET